MLKGSGGTVRCNDRRGGFRGKKSTAVDLASENAGCGVALLAECSEGVDRGMQGGIGGDGHGMGHGWQRQLQEGLVVMRT